MNKNFRKTTGILVAAVFTLTMVLAGCGAKEETTKQATTVTSSEVQASTVAKTGPDISKEVKLKGYMVGDPSKDETTVLDEINKLSKKDINATAEYAWMSWGDYTTKYPILLASGDDFDFIYTANWCFFNDQAQKGAFMALNDLLPVYAPEVSAQVPKEALACATINGKIFAIPSDRTLGLQNGIVYREDLRVKYNVPEIKKFEDFEAYFDAIKKNEKGMSAFALGSDSGFLSNMLFEKYGMTTEGLDNFICYNIDDEKPVIKEQLKTPEYKELLNITKRFKEKGFWSTSDLTSKVKGWQLLPEGKTAAAFTNDTGFRNTLMNVKDKHADWQLNYWCPLSPGGKIPMYSPMGNAVAINANAANPERAVMFVNKLLTNKDYSYLVAYGIKDKHYTLDSNQVPQYPTGVSRDKANFIHENNPVSWLIYKSAIPPQVPDASPQYEAVKKIMSNNAKLCAFTPFVLDTTNIKTELANLTNIKTQYITPLVMGFVKKSVDEDLKDVIAKMDAAGFGKIKDEYQKQTDKFLASLK